MSKRTFALIFTLFIVAVVLVMIAIYNPSSYDNGTPSDIVPTEKPISPAQAEIKFKDLSSIQIASSSGTKIAYSIPITISANKNKITAVQLEISYDSQVLTNVSIAPGTFLQKPVTLLNEKDEVNGRISYALGIPPSSPGIEGEGIVATLSFQTKSLFIGKTAISFLPKTFVTAE